MIDIRICDREQGPQSADIRICSEQEQERTDEIRICKQDKTRDCETAQLPLSVSGEEDCNVGDFYSAAGGTPPYSYSFGGGSIDPQTGEILSISSCSQQYAPRYANVSVTDACGKVAAYEVRLPNGVWRQISSQSSSTGNELYPISVSSCYCGIGQSCNGESVSGGERTTESVQWGSEVLGLGAPITKPAGACGGLTEFSSFSCRADGPNQCETAGTVYPMAKSRSIYEWVCP